MTAERTLIRVLLADDQKLMASALKTIFSSQGDIDVVAIACDGREAIAAADQWSVDVAIVDIQMPVVNGIEAARTIRQRHPDVKILMLTTFNEEELVQQALEAGVQGFMLKDADPQRLIDAVRRIHGGASVLSPAVTEYVIRGFNDSFSASTNEYKEFEKHFTQREIDILQRVALARTNAEIADELTIGPATVKTYVSRLIAKLEARDRVGLAVWAHQSGFMRRHGK